MDEIILQAQSDANVLVFIFHGYGADKENLRDLGEAFSRALPKAEIHLPNGIEDCEEGFGRQWFALEGEDINEWGRAFKNNVSKIMSYVDASVAEKNLGYKDVIFAGFSQGAMLSLGLGLQYEVKAVVAFSGLLLNPGECVQKKNTKVLLAHGAEDTVVPIGAMKMTEEALSGAGISVRTAVSPALPHAIDNYLLGQAVDFLKSL